MENLEINEGHYAELLDRVFVTARMIEEHCFNHPIAKSHPEVVDHISGAMENLAEAYQLIGKLIMQKELDQKS